MRARNIQILVLLHSKKVLLGCGFMGYFAIRDLAGITIFAALWGILNVTVSPIFFQVVQLPFFCDLIGFSTMILAVWYVRKIGTGTFVGCVATIVNLMFRPTSLHFFGFTVACIVFDIIVSLSGYDRLFEKRILGSIGLFGISVFSATIAGLVIGSFFMTTAALTRWGGILGWAGLHSVGGVMGGAVGVSLTNALIARGVSPKIAQIKGRLSR